MQRLLLKGNFQKGKVISKTCRPAHFASLLCQRFHVCTGHNIPSFSQFLFKLQLELRFMFQLQPIWQLCSHICLPCIHMAEFWIGGRPFEETIQIFLPFACVHEHTSQWGEDTHARGNRWASQHIPEGQSSETVQLYWDTFVSFYLKKWMAPLRREAP